MIVVPISAIEHAEYCARQCALIHVDGVWTENEHTVRGSRAHRWVDQRWQRKERGRVVVRAVPLWSERHGLTGRADAIEVHPDGAVVPVEYKAGRRHGDTAHLQLCAQALCLEEMLRRPIPVGRLWYAGPRKSVRVRLDDELRARTIVMIERIRGMFVGDRLPPAVADERCSQCQLAAHCLPTMVAEPTRVMRYLQEVLWSSS